MKKTCGLILCLATPFTASAIDIKPTGDFRTGYYYIDDSSKGKKTEIRFRVRAGIKAKINQNLSAKFRFAGRAYANSVPFRKNDVGFDYLDATPAYADSIPAGQTTIDEAFLKYSFKQDSYFRFGRFKSSYEMKGVAKKSLDRNNSPNSDIAWTDGAHLSLALPGNHRLNAIAQYNPANGTAVLRKPISLAREKSRLSYFLGLQHTKKAGPFVQREIDLTVMPAALCESGVDTSNNNRCNSGIATTYVAAAVRVATQWPVANTGTKFLLGTELGYAPTTADKDKVSGGDDGVAYQITFNFTDYLPKHGIGFVYGKAGGGWLISPDFSSNYTLKEVRYAWKFAKKQKLELRFREREQIVGGDRTRDDVYVRYTMKF